MKGAIGEINGVPIFEDKLLVREGTYICLDREGLPIKQKDLDKKIVDKIVVHDFKSFKIAMKNNQERTNHERYKDKRASI